MRPCTNKGPRGWGLSPRPLTLLSRQHQPKPGPLVPSASPFSHVAWVEALLISTSVPRRMSWDGNNGPYSQKCEGQNTVCIWLWSAPVCFFRIKLAFIIHTLHRKGDLVNRAELYEKQLGWSTLLCLHTEAALFSQSWAHSEQPAGQQEVHL